MTESIAAPVAPAYRDRRLGLLLFGILELLLGAACVLLVPLMIFSQIMSARMTGMEPNFRMIVPGALVYAGLAMAFVWLGVGSIKRRRWARALLLILAWSWLAVGVLMVAIMSVVLPRFLGAGSVVGAALPAGMRLAMILVPLLFLGVFFVALPGGMVWFYGSRHVKATCEASDPAPRWTDACPLPLLAVTCWLWFGSLGMLVMPFGYGGVMPFFGVLLSGLPGGLVCLVLAAVWLGVGWMFYRLRPAGWWILAGVLVLMSISNAITFTRVDIFEMYRKMGYPEAQIELIKSQGLFAGSAFQWWSLGAMVPLLAYLLWVKRFFHAPQSGNAGAHRTDGSP